MQFVNTIYQGAQDYWNDVPTNTGKQTLYAMGAGFILETLMTGNPSKGVVSAVLSGLATTIYGLVTPLFKTVIGKPTLSWGEEMCRTFTAIIGAGCVEQAVFGNSTVFKYIGVLTFAWGIITYIDPVRRDLNSCDWIIV